MSQYGYQPLLESVGPVLHRRRSECHVISIFALTPTPTVPVVSSGTMRAVCSCPIVSEYYSLSTDRCEMIDIMLIVPSRSAWATPRGSALKAHVPNTHR
ncbi:unnamed protein product [Arctia plantaginis]|uniref:Uncharacterized protein n=1 Tax=Arctia plantaginis TaxID=874455 RepID=A0A8S0ZVV1_ARCPL|nr:unnamed protein product [Arctia plantaginis]CAB3238906.1 unnamed protein product [Arctia plantaginis]